MSQPSLVFLLCRRTPFIQMMDQCSCQLSSQGWNNSDPCPITPLTFIWTSRHDRPSPKGRWKTGLCSCRYNIIVVPEHFHVHRWRVKSQDRFQSRHHSHADERTPNNLFPYATFRRDTEITEGARKQEASPGAKYLPPPASPSEQWRQLAPCCAGWSGPYGR